MSSIRKIEHDNDMDKLLNRVFTSTVRASYVEVGEDNVCLPIYYQKYQEPILNFEIYEDDVFICGHPKTGTTWSSEMVWLLMNDLNYEEAANKTVFNRVRHLEFSTLFELDALTSHYGNDYFKQFNKIITAKRPRCIKTHLHWSLIPEQIQNGLKKPKMIVTLRGPEDTCVSYYHHSLVAEAYKGTLDEFCTLFLAGRITYGPFWKQVLSYWNQRDRPNLLFITYEDMIDDLPMVIRKVASFLDKTISDKEVDVLSKHLSFKSMKDNPSTNYGSIYDHLKQQGYGTKDSCFLRSGKVGGYTDEMLFGTTVHFKVWSHLNSTGTGLKL